MQVYKSVKIIASSLTFVKKRDIIKYVKGSSSPRVRWARTVRTASAELGVCIISGFKIKQDF